MPPKPPAKPAAKAPAKAPAKAISPAQAPKTAKMVSAVKAASKLPAFKAAKKMVQFERGQSPKPQTARQAANMAASVREEAATRAAKQVGREAVSRGKLAAKFEKSANMPGKSPYDRAVMQEHSARAAERASKLNNELKALQKGAKIAGKQKTRISQSDVREFLRDAKAGKYARGGFSGGGRSMGGGGGAGGMGPGRGVVKQPRP